MVEVRGGEHLNRIPDLRIERGANHQHRQVADQGEDAHVRHDDEPAGCRHPAEDQSRPPPPQASRGRPGRPGHEGSDTGARERHRGEQRGTDISGQAGEQVRRAGGVVLPQREPGSGERPAQRHQSVAERPQSSRVRHPRRPAPAHFPEPPGAAVGADGWGRVILRHPVHTVHRARPARRRGSPVEGAHLPRAGELRGRP